MNIDYWIELHADKKRLVLTYLLQIKTLDHKTVKESCPDRHWIDQERIDGQKIPLYILKMNEKQLRGELALNGGAIKWI